MIQAIASNATMPNADCSSCMPHAPIHRHAPPRAAGARHDSVETRAAAMPRIRFDFGALVLEAEVLDTPIAGPM
jgi:hypothetical protein